MPNNKKADSETRGCVRRAVKGDTWLPPASRQPTIRRTPPPAEPGHPPGSAAALVRRIVVALLKAVVQALWTLVRRTDGRHHALHGGPLLGGGKALQAEARRVGWPTMEAQAAPRGSGFSQEQGLGLLQCPHTCPRVGLSEAERWSDCGMP